MSDKNQPTIAPALDKGLEIIELLSTCSRPLLLTEIARSLGRKVSEIQRMVQTLVMRGFLYRESQGGYFLSSKLFQMAHQYPPFNHLVEIARPAMEEFSGNTGESVHLSVLYEQKALIIQECQGNALVRITLRIGTILSLTATVSGLVLISEHGPRDLDNIFSAPNDDPKKKDVNKQLKKIRTEGYLYRLSAAYHGLHDLGVSVKLDDGTILAALTTTWAKSRTRPATRDALLPHLKNCSESIAERLRSA